MHQLTEAFPIVSWSPFAVVRLPYRGVLAGSQLYGSPTITYRPIAQRKHAKYFTPGVVLVSKMI